MSNYYNQQSWDQGVYGDQYNDQYGNDNTGGEYYYDESNQQYDYYQQAVPGQEEYYTENPQPSYEQYDYDPSITDDTTTSLFYTSNPPLVVHNYGYDTQGGDPISAIATTTSQADDTKLTYVASHTSAEQTRPIQGSGHKSFRGSRMTILYENTNIQDGAGENRHIYSSFGAHPEAETDTLNRLHSQLFGDGTVVTTPSQTPMTMGSHKPRPTNSYGPSFGPPYLVNHSWMYAPNRGQGYNHQRAEEKHCMGISSILPLGGDRVCTVSPYGVRIHTRGGAVISDKDGMGGRTCGNLIGVDFVLSGGMPTGSGDVGRNVHCMDLRRDLKVISSHTLMSDAGSSKHVCTVADMALNKERNTIVAGCTDGTVRLLDGERRMVEVAKAKAQRGGVAKVAVYDVSTIACFLEITSSYLHISCTR